MQDEHDVISIDGNYLARCFKYNIQFFNTYQTNIIPLKCVVYKSLYNKHKCVFDKLAKILHKFKFDGYSYIEFFVRKRGKRESDIDEQLISVSMLNSYLEYLRIRYRRRSVYDSYMSSINNIVDDCIRLQYFNVIDYLKYLIKEHKLAGYLYSGKITEYVFASIPHFKKVIEKLDPISRDEFKLIYDRYEKYNSDITDAFLQVRNVKINTIDFINTLILERTAKN